MASALIALAVRPPVVVQEKSGSTVTNSYVYGADLLSETDNNNVTTYLLQDGLGSTTGLTNSSGSVTDTYTYDAFGATKTHTGTSPNVWKFTGEQNDVTVNQSPYYLRARYYDPVIGRFLTRDPWPANSVNVQSLDRYPYVYNDPAALIDPYGLCGWKSPWDCPQQGAEKVAGAAKQGAEAVKNGVAAAEVAMVDGARWVGDDYHWTPYLEAGGIVALGAGISIASGGTLAPFVAEALAPFVATTLALGGVSAIGVGVAFNINHEMEECKGGDKLSCVLASSDIGAVPFDFINACGGSMPQSLSGIDSAIKRFGELGDKIQGAMKQSQRTCVPPKE